MGYADCIQSNARKVFDAVDNTVENWVSGPIGKAGYEAARYGALGVLGGVTVALIVGTNVGGVIGCAVGCAVVVAGAVFIDEFVKEFFNSNNALIRTVFFVPYAYCYINLLTALVGVSVGVTLAAALTYKLAQYLLHKKENAFEENVLVPPKHEEKEDLQPQFVESSTNQVQTTPTKQQTSMEEQD